MGKGFTIGIVSVCLLLGWFVPSIIDRIEGDKGEWWFFYICLFFTCAHWYDKVSDYLDKK